MSALVAQAPVRSARTECPQECSCRAGPADWFRRYASAIRQFVYSRTGDPGLADEFTAETFARACARCSRFVCRGEGVRPWLFVIARNIVLDRGKPGWVRYEVPAEELHESRDVAPTPEEAVVRADTISELTQHLRRLPEDQARCLRLRFFADHSVAQTAAAMRRNEGAVRALQYRAIRNLASMLAETEQLSSRAA